MVAECVSSSLSRFCKWHFRKRNNKVKELHSAISRHKKQPPAAAPVQFKMERSQEDHTLAEEEARRTYSVAEVNIRPDSVQPEQRGGATLSQVLMSASHGVLRANIMRRPRQRFVLRVLSSRRLRMVGSM